MPSLYEQVEQIRRHQVTADKLGSVGWGARPGPKGLVTMPDHGIMTFHKPAAHPGRLVFDTTGQLYNAIIQLGYQIRPGMDDMMRKYAKDTRAHEEAHAKHARSVGVKAVRFALVAFDGEAVPQSEYWSGRTTRLAFLTGSLAPVDPSDGDIEALVRCGIESPKDLMRRIETYHDVGHTPRIPIPDTLRKIAARTSF